MEAFESTGTGPDQHRGYKQTDYSRSMRTGFKRKGGCSHSVLFSKQHVNCEEFRGPQAELGVCMCLKLFAFGLP